MAALPPLLGKTAVDRIFEAFENTGYKPGRAAVEMKMPTSTVYSWKSGDKAPGRDSMRKVAALTGYTLSEIEGDDAAAQPVVTDDPEALVDFLQTPSGKRAASSAAAMEYLRTPHFRRLGMTSEGYHDLFRAFEASEAGRLIERREMEARRQETVDANASMVAEGRTLLTSPRAAKSTKAAAKKR